MNLMRLRYFITVTKYASFTKASEVLFVTQPTVSRQILELEKELEVKLLVRSRKSINLTEAGKRLLPVAQEIVKKCDVIQELVKQEQGINKYDGKNILKGSIKIGYQSYLHEDMIYDILKSLTKNFFFIDFPLYRGNPNEIKKGLINDKFDIVFSLRTCVSSIKNLEYIKLHENKLQIIVPRDHRLAKYNSVNLKDLSNEKFIMLERKVSPFTVDYAIGLCMNNGFSPQASYYVDNAKTAMLFVGLGKGISFLHSQINICNNISDKIADDIKVLELKYETNNNLDWVLAYKKNNSNPIIPKFISEVLSYQKINGR